MKFAIVFAAIIAVGFAAAINGIVDDSQTQVLRYDNDMNEKGEFSYTVELSDGTIRHEESTLVDAGLETEHMIVKGYFVYKGPEGQLFRTDYQANTDGYQPEGEHLPKNE